MKTRFFDTPIEDMKDTSTQSSSHHVTGVSMSRATVLLSRCYQGDIRNIVERLFGKSLTDYVTKTQFHTIKSGDVTNTTITDTFRLRVIGIGKYEINEVKMKDTYNIGAPVQLSVVYEDDTHITVTLTQNIGDLESYAIDRQRINVRLWDNVKSILSVVILDCDLY